MSPLLLLTIQLALTGAAPDHRLIPGPEWLGVETALPDVIVLLVRANGTDPDPSQSTADYLVDGRPPVRVHRASAPIYEERCLDWNRQLYPVIVLHRLYLVLPDRLAEGGTYHLATPLGQRDWQFSDRQTSCESIKVNQVGYHRLDPAPRAMFAAWLGDGGGVPLTGVDRFELRRAADHTVVGSQPVVVAREDPNAGGPASILDFAPPGAEGRYYLALPGVGRSPEFGWGDSSSHHSFYTHLKGLYHQRCGIALEKPYTHWTRPACHLTMTVTDAEPPDFIKLTGDERRPSSGGHHDAGDFDQRFGHTLVPGWLLDACELCPGKFTDRQLDIPESGNGIPDLLDEALWAIRRWEVLQEADGGIRAGVEADRHPTYGEVTAATDKLEYRTYRRYGHSTLAGAALFAWAGRLVRPHDPARADELLSRATRAWGFYQQHQTDPAYRWSPGALLFAGCQLYLATGEPGAHETFLAQARHFCELDGQKTAWPAAYHGIYYNLQTIDEGMAFTHYFSSYLLDDSRPRDERVLAALRQAVVRKADETLAELGRRDWAYLSTNGWGMATGVGRWGDFLLHAWRLTGDERYRGAACRLADFALGVNPAGWCFTTGLGSRPPYNPLQLDSYPHLATLGPAPGIVIYGVAGVSKQPYYRAVLDHVYPSILDGQVPKLRAITDGWSVITQNEFTTAETMAPNSFLHACLAPEKPLAGQVVPWAGPVAPGGYPPVSP